MGVKQTEVDSAIQLQPGLIQRTAVDAIAPFYDRRARPSSTQKSGTLGEAQRIVDADRPVSISIQVREAAAAKRRAANRDRGDQ